MGRKMAGVMLMTIVTTGGPIVVNAQAGSPRVRPEDAAVRALIERGMERSPTFRDLHNGLDSASVIVYVRSARCYAGVPACLVWAPAGTDMRRLLIKIDRFGRSPNELIALLAHELQHAHEVAASPDITDVTSFQKSFAARGWKHGSGFETEQAKVVTRRVVAELIAR